MLYMYLQHKEEFHDATSALSWSLRISSRPSSFYIPFRMKVIKMKGSQKVQEWLYEDP